MREDLPETCSKHHCKTPTLKDGNAVLFVHLAVIEKGKLSLKIRTLKAIKIDSNGE
jgi:hypothetical protein